MSKNETTVDTTKVITKKSRLCFPNIFEPIAATAKIRPGQYGAALTWPKTDKVTTELVEAAVKAAMAKGATLPANKNGWAGLTPKKFEPSPLKDGNVERPKDPAYKDCWVVNAYAKTKPGIVRQDPDTKLLIDITDPNVVYAGCYVIASINFFPYNYEGKCGVGVGLNNIIKVKDGERLAGKPTADADFAGIEIEDDEDFG